MVHLALKFVSCLRASDLRISTSEVLDCIRHLKLIDVLDEHQFKTALKTNFIKSARDRDVFEHLYHLFFHELNTNFDWKNTEDTKNKISPEWLKEELIQKIRDAIGNEPTIDAVLDFISGDPLAYLKMIQELQTKTEQKQVVNSNLGQLTERLQIMLQINKIKNIVPQFLESNESSLPAELTGMLESRINDLLNNAYSLLTDEEGPNNSSLSLIRSGQKASDSLGNIPFSNLSQKQIEDMRVTIDQLVRKLNDMVTKRAKAKNKGILDIKKTLRKSAKYQGTPIEVIYKDKPKKKGKIIALCDVSGSVWSTAKFMLNMLYSLQDCFSKVKSFIFISGIHEVTDFFETYETNDAIEKIMNEADINYGAMTDYGATFKSFKKDHMNDLDKKTTLIIIGDARSNYMDPRERILGEMREKCRRVIWLNSEPEQFWGTGDSEMNTYTSYCHEARVCQNLNQLTDFIEELVL